MAITLPSAFGSHSCMVFMRGTHTGKVVCYDGLRRSVYVTFESRLDDGLADPNRLESVILQDVDPPPNWEA